MDEQKDIFALLDMMVQPVFCVKDNLIIRSNPAARQLLLEPGCSILPLLEGSMDAYSDFSGGCLYLPLTIAGQTAGASVRRLEGFDVFDLDAGHDSEVLQALALASGTLRRPLSSAMADTASLLDSQEDPDTVRQLSQLNRSLHQLLRLLANMSDADQISRRCRMETADLSAFFREVFGKAQALVLRSDVELQFDGPKEPVFCLADRGQLERAVFNILSNALKFTPQGGAITAALVRRGAVLQLTVEDSGGGIAREALSSLFRRYLRQPGIEDSRFGLGLGLHLVRAAALNHGGTLLLNQSKNGGTRVVLTIAIRQREAHSMHSPVFEIDYAGGFDHGLVELSESLPADLYDGSY